MLFDLSPYMSLNTFAHLWVIGMVLIIGWNADRKRGK